MAAKRQGARTRTPQQKYAFLWRLVADTGLSLAAKAVTTALLLRFHNAKTGRCDPSISRLAKTVGIGRRTVFNAIDELRDTGWITVKSTHGGAPSHTNQYAFDFDRTASASPSTGAPNAPPTGANSARVHEMPPTGAKSAHEPSRTTSPFGAGGGGKAGQRAPDGALEKFEELRALWQRPHGMNAVKVQAAFNRAIRDGVAPELLLESARRWIQVVEPTYLPALERWLDDGAWRNDPPMRRRNSSLRPSAAEVAAGLAEGAARDEEGAS